VKIKSLPHDAYVPPEGKGALRPLLAGIFTRLQATALDIGIPVIIISQTERWFGAGTNQYLPFFVAAYYLGCEMTMGITLGKMLLGLDMVSIRGPLTGAKVIQRNILRFVLVGMVMIIPFGLLLMIPWFRVTMLDKMTGVRVLGRAFRTKKKRGVDRFDEKLLVR